MDRYDFEEQIKELLDKAHIELPDTEFEILLCKIDFMVSDYE